MNERTPGAGQGPQRPSGARPGQQRPSGARPSGARAAQPSSSVRRPSQQPRQPAGGGVPPQRPDPGAQPPKKEVSGARRTLDIVKSVLANIGRGIATVIMVGIITGCIVACIMTVYILKYIGADNEVNLDSIMLGNTSIIYTMDPETEEPVELQRLYQGGQNRIWVDYDSINDYAKNAIVAIEDKRFWDHDGVDWRRTFGAFLNLFIPMSGTTAGGGSTITQQLIKNVTQDDDYRIERKVREIFRALDLSKRYSREQILEAYLNVAPLGNGTIGIQAAANTYFDKDASQLTLAEAASIVGITQYPGYYDPFKNPENNKNRQEHILAEMLDQGYITRSEHDEAVAQRLEFKQEKYSQSVGVTQSYFVDHVIEEVIADLMDQKDYTRAHATEQIYSGGYRIYITMDSEIQAHLEEFYSSVDNFTSIAPVWNAEYPQSACVITDTNGKVLAMVGGIGEKTANRVLNRATQSRRQPGSAIKPLAAYAMAFQNDLVTWSTKVDDNPIENPDGSGGVWPRNHYGAYYGPITVEEAIQRSTNTIPVRLVEQLTPRRVYDFLYNDLHFHSLVDSVTTEAGIASDINLSGMALGGVTYGVTPLEMAGGYQIYANGGYFTEPYTYTRVMDSSGRTVLEKDTTPRRVLSEDTAVVINKLLQRVVNARPGTGTTANLGSMPTAGKTGTSSEDVDQWFVGMTPYYVCQVWLGYDEKGASGNSTGTIGYNSYAPPILFRAIMAPLHENLEYKNFVDSANVVSMQFCTVTGLLAADGCPAATGWYKSSNVPRICTGHASEEADDGSSDAGSGSSGSSSGSSSSSSSSGGGSLFDLLDRD